MIKKVNQMRKQIPAALTLLLMINCGGSSNKTNRNEVKVNETARNSETENSQNNHSYLTASERTSSVVSKLPDQDSYQVVWFTASWCGPCVGIKPTFDAIAKKGNRSCHRMLIHDMPDDPREEMKKYGITSVPYVIVWHRKCDGSTQEIRRFGPREFGELAGFVSNLPGCVDCKKSSPQAPADPVQCSEIKDPGMNLFRSQSQNTHCQR